MIDVALYESGKKRRDVGGQFVDVCDEIVTKRHFRVAGSEDRGEYDRDGLHVDAVVRGHGELVGDVNVDVVTVDKGQDGLHQEWTRWVTSDEFTNKLKQFFIVVRCCSLDRLVESSV